METLHYWITRLEPIIRSEDGDEVIVVFANRCGMEDDALYAGTSAVVGIQNGEVRVYGILGRGVKDLLVVDTNVPPSARLVDRPDGAFVAAARSGSGGKDMKEKQQTPPARGRGLPGASQGNARGGGFDAITSMQGCENNSAKSPVKSNASVQSTPTQPGRASSKTRSPESSHRHERRDLSLRIDSSSANDEADAPTIQTPTCPSPTPISLRPRLVIPPTDSITMRYLNEHSAMPPTTAVNTAYPAHKLTPHPNALSPIEQVRILGGEVMITREGTTPGTSPSQVSMSHFSDASPLSPKFYWIPAGRMLETPLEKRGWTPGAASDRTDFSDTSLVETCSGVTSALSHRNYPASSVQITNAQQIPPGGITKPSLTSKFHVKDSSRGGGKSHQDNNTEVDRPSSPKSRNASRSRGPERPGSTLEPNTNLEQLTQKLDEISQRVDSAQGTHTPQQRRHSLVRGPNDGMSAPDNSIPIAACSSIWQNSPRLGSRTSADGPPTELKSSKRGSPMPQGEKSSRIARGRAENRPASRSSSHQHHQSSKDMTRQVSRGRHPEVHTPPRQNGWASLHPENRSKTAGEADVELSHFRHIEEFTSPSCPIHGSRSHSEVHQDEPHGHYHETYGHHGAHVNGASHGYPHPRPVLMNTLEQKSCEQAAPERPNSSSTKVLHSDRHSPGARASPRSKDSGTPLSFEPKTPKAMTLVFEPNSPQLSDSGLKSVEPNHGPSISRPKSAVW